LIFAQILLFQFGFNCPAVEKEKKTCKKFVQKYHFKSKKNCTKKNFNKKMYKNIVLNQNKNLGVNNDS
jgi:hypothetical protein